jgi:hypothetical protein
MAMSTVAKTAVGGVEAAGTKASSLERPVAVGTAGRDDQRDTEGSAGSRSPTCQTGHMHGIRCSSSTLPAGRPPRWCGCHTLPSSRRTCRRRSHSCRHKRCCRRERRKPLLREAGGPVATAEEQPEAEVMGKAPQAPAKAAAPAGEEMALGPLAGSMVEVAMGTAIEEVGSEEASSQRHGIQCDMRREAIQPIPQQSRLLRRACACA